MTIVLSLFFLGTGVALIVNTIMTPRVAGYEFSRHGGPPIRNRRIMPIVIGTIVALGGLALLLFSRTGSP